MSKFYEVALAIDARDAELVLGDIERITPRAREFRDETPDNTYLIYHWNWIEWQGEAVEALLKKLESIRHSLYTISEEDEVYKENVTEDAWGCDEQFYEMLDIKANIRMWDDTVVLGEKALPFDFSLAVPWAKFPIEESRLAECEALEESEEISTGEIFAEEFNSDCDRDFPGLIRDYRNLDALGRSVVDATLVRICGWSLPTLCRMSEEKAAHYDDFPREEQESVLSEMLGYLANFSSFDSKESFDIEEDEDFIVWPPLKLYNALCEVGSYLLDLWSSNHTDAEIRDKLLDMGVPVSSHYLEDFGLEPDFGEEVQI